MYWRRLAENLRGSAPDHHEAAASVLFPELADGQLRDDEPSCSAAEALERQEPFVNPTLANHALALAARLFRYGRISCQGGFVSLTGTARVQPLPIIDVSGAFFITPHIYNRITY